MSIDIIEPLTGGVLGPGIRIRVVTDAIGPFPVDHHWDISLTPLSNENDWRYRDQHYSQLNAADFVFMAQDLYQPLQAADTVLTDGADMRMVVRRMEGTTQVESLSQTVKLDMRSGLPFYNQKRGIYDAGESTGLTPEQAAQLTAIEEATIVKMGVTGTVADIPIDILVPAPPYGLQKVEPGFTPAAGDGFLPGDGPGLVSYYGLWWEFVTVPPGVGFDDWPTRMYEQQLMQLRVIHTLDGVDIVTQLENVNADRYYFAFAQVLPTRVEYSILPGVEVRFHRVVFRFRDA